MKIKSALLTSMSGSIGGLTGSHNRGGLYLRARTIPVNPSSSQQQSVRNAMGILATSWVETLSVAQRDEWSLYADSVEITDALGDQRKLSGINWYCACNVPRIQAGFARVDDGPTVFDLATFTEPNIASVSEASQDFAVEFDDGDAWANEDDGFMAVYLSRPVNQSVQFFKGPYRLAGTIDGDGATPPTSPATLSSPFAITQGQKVFMQVRVCRADGRISSTFRDGASVAA